MKRSSWWRRAKQAFKPQCHLLLGDESRHGCRWSVPIAVVELDRSRVIRAAKVYVDGGDIEICKAPILRVSADDVAKIFDLIEK